MRRQTPERRCLPQSCTGRAKVRMAGQPGYREQLPVSLSSISLCTKSSCNEDMEPRALSLPRRLSTLKRGAGCLRVGLGLITMAGRSRLPLSVHCFIVLPFQVGHRWTNGPVGTGQDHPVRTYSLVLVKLACAMTMYMAWPQTLSWHWGDGWQHHCGAPLRMGWPWAWVLVTQEGLSARNPVRIACGLIVDVLSTLGEPSRWSQR